MNKRIVFFWLMAVATMVSLAVHATEDKLTWGILAIIEGIIWLSSELDEIRELIVNYINDPE